MCLYASEKEITTHINTSLHKIDGSAAEKVCWWLAVWAWGAVMDEQPLELSFYAIKIRGLNVFWHYWLLLLTQMLCFGGKRLPCFLKGARVRRKELPSCVPDWIYHRTGIQQMWELGTTFGKTCSAHTNFANALVNKIKQGKTKQKKILSLHTPPPPIPVPPSKD